MKNKTAFIHESGPFQGIVEGDILTVIYHGAPTSQFIVSKVKEHSIEGKDGDWWVKVTKVSERELRFYGEISQNRQTVLRGIELRKN